MKKLLIILLIFLLLIAGGALAGIGLIKNMAAPVSAADDGNKVRIEIPSGMSVSGAAKLLAENQLIRNEKLFYYTARYPKIKSFLYGKGEDKAFILRSGIYYISPSMNIAQIQEELPEGLEIFYKTLEDSIYNCLSLEEVKRFYS
jgi:UPF0755 protein